MYDEIQATVELVARILAKYPRHTLPERLKPLNTRYQNLSVRLSSFHEDELVLTLGTAFHGSQTVRIPAAWVGACQGDVSREVRKAYWDYQEEARHREFRSVQRRIERLQQQQTEAAVELGKLTTQLEDLRPRS